MFPQTQSSVVAALGSADSALRLLAYEKIVAAYWKPAYKHVRLRWKTGNEDAQDLVQGFFTCALDKTFFRDFEPARGTFRTYLRTCLDRFVAKENQAVRRIKRGGGIMVVSLDFDGAERELALATRTLRAHSGTLESRSTMRWRSRNKRKCSHLVGSLGGGVCGRQSASGP